MAIYTGTEHFFKREVEAVSDILRARGFREECFTCYKTSLHYLENKAITQ